MKGIEVKQASEKKPKHFPVVAIGASAGGIEAMTQLLKSLPENTGMCYIYIQHLNPDHESKLTEIFKYRYNKVNEIFGKWPHQHFHLEIT